MYIFVKVTASYLDYTEMYLLFLTTHLTENTKREGTVAIVINVHILHTHTHNVCACKTSLFLDCIIKIVK
jgi:hypothetical protein